jgi:hypothetical protein
MFPLAAATLVATLVATTQELKGTKNLPLST